MMRTATFGRSERGESEERFGQSDGRAARASMARAASKALNFRQEAEAEAVDLWRWFDLDTTGTEETKAKEERHPGGGGAGVEDESIAVNTVPERGTGTRRTEAAGQNQ